MWSVKRLYLQWLNIQSSSFATSFQGISSYFMNLQWFRLAHIYVQVNVFSKSGFIHFWSLGGALQTPWQRFWLFGLYFEDDDKLQPVMGTQFCSSAGLMGIAIGFTHHPSQAYCDQELVTPDRVPTSDQIAFQGQTELFSQSVCRCGEPIDKREILLGCDMVCSRISPTTHWIRFFLGCFGGVVRSSVRWRTGIACSTSESCSTHCAFKILYSEQKFFTYFY